MYIFKWWRKNGRKLEINTCVTNDHEKRTVTHKRDNPVARVSIDLVLMGKTVKEGEWGGIKRKERKKDERLRIVSKRTRTENRRWVEIHQMPGLRSVSMSEDSKTNVFMR